MMFPYSKRALAPYQYRKKVEAYIREHEDHIAIYKLKRNVPLTDRNLAELEEMLFSAEEVESTQSLRAGIWQRSDPEIVYPSDCRIRP